MQDSLIKQLAWWSVVVLVIFSAWQAGSLTWHIWHSQQTIVASAQLPPAYTQAKSVKATPSWGFFGEPEKALPQLQEVQKDAPKTRLNLQLMGVVVGTEPKDSGAIIAGQNGNTGYFKVDQTIINNVRLVGVFDKHVILSRNGVQEKLSFDEQPVNNFRSVSQADSSTSIKPADIETPEQFMDVAQARLSANPVAALASVGLSPGTDNGNPAGYVYDGNNPMLAAMNMQKGDVIRSVNGHILGDMEVDRAKLQEFYESGLLEVEIEREGAVFTINYPIP